MKDKIEVNELKIEELETGMNSVTLTADVKEITDLREVQTKFGPNTVANALIEDDTGSIKLVLWGKQIDKVKPGTKIEITGAYVKEWRDEKQVNLPRNSEITVIEGAAEEAAPAEETVEEETVEEEAVSEEAPAEETVEEEKPAEETVTEETPAEEPEKVEEEKKEEE